MAERSRLSVNVNAVAYLRNRRTLPWPDPVDIAARAMEGGAKGITVHPRPDERHIGACDVAALALLFARRFADHEFCLEGYPEERFWALVERHRPHQVLLVPDAPGQTTSDHGWEIAAHRNLLREGCARIAALGLRPALFIDPYPDAARAAADLGAARVEIYTGPYGACYDDGDGARREADRIGETARAAHEAGLGVNAGHDLTCANIPALCERIPVLAEVSIGHGFVAEALAHGTREAVRRFRIALGEIAEDTGKGAARP